MCSYHCIIFLTYLKANIWYLMHQIPRSHLRIDLAGVEEPTVTQNTVTIDTLVKLFETAAGILLIVSSMTIFRNRKTIDNKMRNSYGSEKIIS